MISPKKTKYQTNRTLNTYQSIPVEESFESQIHQLQNQLQALKSMMTFLLEYQKKCISMVDFDNAKETRIRIKLLEMKEKQLMKVLIEKKQEKQMMTTREENEKVLQEFDTKWSDKLNGVIEELIQSEKKIKQDHYQQKKTLIQKFQQEKNKFKQSLRLVRMKQKLIGLMKLHLYDQAQTFKKDIDQLEFEEMQRWLIKTEERKNLAWTLLSKKQEKEFDVLRYKNQNTIIKQLKERDSKYEILVKKYQLKQNEIKRNKKPMMKQDRVESAEKEKIA